MVWNNQALMGYTFDLQIMIQEPFNTVKVVLN